VNADKAFNVIGSIVTVAMVTVVVSSPGTANVIRAFGEAFSGSLRAAMGKR
jgi:hypothetical protein